MAAAGSASVHTVPEEDVLESFTKSLGMVLFSELGDKTFFMAALLAMRYGRSPVRPLPPPPSRLPQPPFPDRCPPPVPCDSSPPEDFLALKLEGTAGDFPLRERRRGWVAVGGRGPLAQCCGFAPARAGRAPGFDDHEAAEVRGG